MRKNKLILWIVVFAISLGGFLLIYLSSSSKDYRALSNGAFFSFALIFGVMSITLLARFGTFDTISYVGVRFFESMKKEEKRSFDSAYDYHEFKNQKRKSNKIDYLPYIVFSIILLSLTIIFDLLAKTNIG